MNGRRLYEELGGVDERYLQQAATYKAKRKAPAWRTLLIAAALVLVGALLMGTLALSIGVGVVGSLIFDALQQQPDPESPQQPAYTIAAMEQTLAQRQETLYPLTQDKIDLFDQGAQLIWTDGESGEYYRVSLSDAECTRLIFLMQNEQRLITEQSEQPSYQIWISFGDGVVVSPYLKSTAGNAGHGALFDYDPELELSEQLIRQIMQYVRT